MTVRTLGPTESELHRSVADLLDWVLLPPAMYSTFPAGWGQLSKTMAQRLRKCGLKPGMPDIMIFPGLGRCFGIELKAGKNVLTPDQKAMHEKLQAAGIRVVVCRAVEHVMVVLKQESVPHRDILGDKRWSQGHRELPLGETFAKRGVDGEVGGSDGTKTQTHGVSPGIAARTARA